MLDTGTGRCFKAKYQKKLVSCIVARIDEGKSSSKYVDALRAIQWMQEAWVEVTSSTI